ncbi:acyl-CoA dehydratase activase-related protein [Natranaerofaba carboxydovora]|uniref:acyl-CoA dehydratase activase-related protein n=1 Tax=Natranaerofaba carboxydovora TaxID=2742683 RepID=UPI001F142AA4|nr:acyl-CoA dehydratase activase-related protein [Natranaerofaba carboxydovora]UMZ73912.1 hypothetical protein ACONDI_01482 [Natranaerofaba carboxydovora]
MKIGIPRALLYYNYYPGWKAFFENLGYEVKVSPKTDKKILDDGVKLCIDDVCLPIKIYLGHVKKLIEENEVDTIFAPRFIGVERKKYLCPKLFGLPNLIINQFELSEDRILSPTVDLTKKPLAFLKELISLGNKLNCRMVDTLKSYNTALACQNNYENELLSGNLPLDILEANSNHSDKRRGMLDTRSMLDTKVAVLGHSYNINDDFINHNLIEKLRNSDVFPITTEMISKKSKEKGLKKLEKPIFWTFGKEIIGSAYSSLTDREVDGIILVVSFGCGPDSLINELVEREMKGANIPLLMITLDEHTGEAGINTRVEAFVEMLKRRKQAV